MEDVAHIKGRAVCLHVDVRRVPKNLKFHADVSGGGEAGAPGGKARELAGEQLAAERGEALRVASIKSAADVRVDDAEPCKKRRGTKHDNRCHQFQNEGKCSRDNCPFTHVLEGGV